MFESGTPLFPDNKTAYCILGCGLCAQTCPTMAIAMQKRPQRVVSPYNTAHRVVSMALEHGTLQHILFNNQVLYSHRTLATLLGVILKLPAEKRILAAKLLHSRYLESLLHRWKWQPPESFYDTQVTA